MVAVSLRETQFISRPAVSQVERSEMTTLGFYQA
jgi:hypothetical protein